MMRIGNSNTLIINGKHLSFGDPETHLWLTDSPEQHLRELGVFLRQWFDQDEFIDQQTSGSTGQPKLIRISKTHMRNSAALTIEFFGLKSGQTALLCMSPAYIGGRIMVVRALLAGMNLLVIRPEDNPLKGLEAEIDFAAMVPFQFARALSESPERFGRIRKLILGGASIAPAIEASAQVLETEIWHTYGMSETVSHIALRKVNGVGRENRFRPLRGINLSTDHRGCLCIEAPMLTDKHLITNDLVGLYPDNSFEILGRADNVIISAGVKIHPEIVEQRLADLVEGPLAVVPMPDPEAGAIAVVVLEGRLTPRQLYSFWKAAEFRLPAQELPRRIITLERLPLTGSGKPDRQTIERLVKSMTC